MPALVSALAAASGQIAFEFDTDADTDRIIEALVGEAAALRSALSGKQRRERVELPSNFRRKLTPEQARDLDRLVALPHGANFSVPGAGKTTVTLALHVVLRRDRKLRPLLVIAPRNAFQPWEDENAACFSRPLSVTRLTGGSARVRRLLGTTKAEVLLISYNQAAQSRKELEDFLSTHPGTHLVLDESHRIKRGPAGVWAAAAHSLAPLAGRRDILSGTPLPNGPQDLQSQLGFLWPYRPIISDSDLQSSSPREVGRRIAPLYVRITKEELRLPPQLPFSTKVEMGPHQKAIYQAIRSHAARALAGLTLGEQDALRSMRRNVIRLLQVASNPSLVRRRADEFDLPPADPGNARLSALLDDYAKHEVAPKFLLARTRVEERAGQGKKTIVWSTFVQNLRMLAALLREFSPVVVHGGIPTSTDAGEIEEGSREELIDRFKTNPQTMVLVANPAACGESISLHTVCDYALYVDRNFNAAQLLQSMERIHRLGLPRGRSTSYEFLISPGTIDEIAHQRLDQKLVQMARILNDRGLEQLWLDVDEGAIDQEFDLEDARRVLAHIVGGRA